MKEALGMIETRGLIGAVEAADAMVKACLLYTSSCRYPYRVYGEDIDKIVRTVLIQKDGKYVINRKFVGHDATYIPVSYTHLAAALANAMLRCSRKG